MSAALWLLLSSVALLALTFFLYPLGIALRAAHWPRPWATRAWQPRVSVLMAVHNGDSELESKLDHLLQHDYPAELMELVVVSDGSSDGTAAILRRRAGERLRVRVIESRGGKSAALAEALQLASGDVLVFCDLRQRLEPGAVQALCDALGGGELAVAGGSLRFRPGPSGSASVGVYWRFESWLRRNEALSGSVVGVSGALYALRRSDLPEIPAGLVLDDLYVPLKVAERGGRIGLVDAAIAWDLPAPSAGVEAARKRRTLAGNWQLLARWPALLLPFAHPLWWRFLCHKVLRLLIPFFLLGALVGNSLLALDGEPAWLALLACQLAGHLAGLAALTMPALRRLLPLRLAAAVWELNLYAVLGLWDHLRGSRSHLWQTTPLGAAGERP
ncbi:glycosyltransferase [Pseudomarimonas salicorniae]|uniref:Glycosyltransferase n=1 Tax=Pseudomarimonas salicorniae TaxID=2933270 RepID=A0ABT0GHH4_9GAMM|nr:glycosyltransferase [Lysobacter sp. CAU 1642]MCK7593989.1 glycosyltransferase [Lysobacter sp. CAU 1642]